MTADPPELRRPPAARRPAAAVLLAPVLLAAGALLTILPPFYALALGAVLALGAAAALAAAVRRGGAAIGEPAEPPTPAPYRAGVDGAVAALAERVIAAFPDPVIALDRDGTVLAFNDAAARVAPALRAGEPAVFALRMPAVIDAIRRAAATGAAQRAEFSQRVPVDQWYEAHVRPIEREAAAPEASGGGLMLLTLRDLTPLRRVEEMRADFVANASHELRTPLAALSGFVDTLLGPARDDEKARARFLPIMREQSRRMARLIDDLLSLSRAERDAHVPPDGTVELAGLLRSVVDSLQTLAKDRAVTVRIDGETDLAVRGERDELQRVFENLIENALKYGGGGTRVDIALRAASAGEAEISVRDYGPGIAPQHLPRLTERFYRVDVSHSRAEGGTGLGLSLVKHILQRHRGRLSISSTPGEGASFVVRLPRAGVIGEKGASDSNG